MTAHVVRIKADTYVDSVLLMTAARRMREQEGVEWASALMGTKANVRDLAEQGFAEGDLSKAGSADLVLAVRGTSQEAARAGAEAGERALSERSDEGERLEQRPPRSIGEALEVLPKANLALISVPGEYAALEAHKALTGDLHVLLFSDNVPLADEVALKERGERLGRFVMGPGAGTASVGGVGLGFANVVDRGPVGIVAAAGTGAQECMSLLHRWGAGVRHLIGVGGRDLSEAVGGRMTRLAIRSLGIDRRTEALLLVSKPPAPEVAADLLERLAETGKPAVAALIGLAEDPSPPEGVQVARTLEEGVRATLEQLGMEPPDPGAEVVEEVEEAVRGLADGRRAIRGLYAGGTLCYEAMVVVGGRLGPVHSNVPLREDRGVPAPEGAHVFLDLGEEEFTKGRPHPMIDPELRIERIREEARDDAVAVIVVDVVLGYGAMDDPAGALAPACAEAVERGVRVVAYVLGTEDDPQGYERQRRTMEAAGCLVAPTSARSALMAAAIAARRPQMAGEAP